MTELVLSHPPVTYLALAGEGMEGCWSSRLQQRTTVIALFAARQRDENARHRLGRAPFPKAHGKGRPAHFYPVKNFAVRFGKR
jgi:hypothetical protein